VQHATLMSRKKGRVGLIDPVGPSVGWPPVSTSRAPTAQEPTPSLFVSYGFSLNADVPVCPGLSHSRNAGAHPRESGARVLGHAGRCEP